MGPIRMLLLMLLGKVGGLTDLSNMIEVDGVGHHQFGSLVGGSSSGASTPDRGSAPQWTVQPANEVSFSNSTGSKLECMASGKPLPTIEWFQEDELIAQNLHGLRMVMPNGSLIFPAFTSEQYRDDVHQGLYRCRARNRLGTILSRLVRVNAVVDEDYTVTVQDVEVLRGNTAILRCEVPEHLKSHIEVTSWLHEEGTAIEIFPERDPRGKYTLLQSGDLLIHHTSTYDTYKKYVCKTEHILSGIRRRSLNPARLTLKEPQMSTISPKLIEPFDAIKIYREVMEGQHVLLPCVAQGYPVPESTWFKIEGVGLRQVLPSPKIKHHLEVLILHELLVEDSGIYVCIMNNTAGAERIEVNLTVRSLLDTLVTPSQQIIDLNQPAIFTCTVTGYPRQHVYWIKNGQTFQLDGHRFSSAPNGTLKIFTVQEGDEGSYQCVAENDKDMSVASGSLLLGDAMPVLLYKFSEQTLQPGPSVSLKCIAKGNPPPQILWTRDGFPIPQDARYLIGQYVTIHDDVISHINITSVNTIDGGLYGCSATNSIGSIIYSAKLNVYGPPHVRQTSPVKAIEGHTLQIACPASGYPIEGILWKKDGYDLPNHGRQSVFPNGTLVIENANKIHDEGFYTCTAFNSQEDSHTGTIQIEVLTPPTIMPFLFPNKLLNEGMRSAVSCQILEGSLPIQFDWTKDGLSLGSSGIDGVTIRGNDEYSSTLIIDHLRFLHRGNYTCKASNAAGFATHSAELTVNVPPKWIREPEDVHAVLGQDVVLSCQVEGYPKPTLLWTRANDFGAPLNYQVLPLGLAYNQFPNGTLLISSVDKASKGAYTCTAQNGIRSAISKTINVTVNAPPHFSEKSVRLSVRKGERASLICEASGDQPMDISWKRNGIPISQDEDARFTMVEHVNGEESVSRYLIAPILDQDGGEVVCEVTNRFGRDSKIFLLSIEDVPASPGSVRLSAIKSRSLEISWTRPHDGNSPILNYIIEYSNLPDRRDQGDRQRRKMTAPGDANSLVVLNLRPGTRYKFRVAAENRHGISPESQAVTTRMLEEAPSAEPRSLTVSPKSSTQLEMTWEAPPLSHWNSEHLSYKVGYKQVGETNGFSYIDLHPSNELTQRFVLQSLHKFTSYQISIQAYNQQGIGPSSATAVATTMEDVPSGAPQKINCQSRSPNSILLEWSKPEREERNGIIRGYWLQYYPRTLWYETSGRLQTQETEGEMLELDGLDTFTNYSIKVAAFTRAGQGKASKAIYCRTAEDVPSAPADIKAVMSGDSSVIVSWRTPTLANGILQKYTVYRREIISGKEVDVRESSVLSGPNYLELSALQSNRRYDIWVKAETSAGYGASSDITSIILGHTVRARIVSFGEILAVPWKTNLVLDCLHVGEPRPNVLWQHRHRSIRDNSKHQIFPNGSLSIQTLAESDQGDYTCSVQNAHGSDQIVYEIIVQVPPTSPQLSVRNLTFTQVQLFWTDSRSRKQPVLGYKLYYRKEHGQWDFLDTDPLSKRFWLQDLNCGTNYSIYMSAYNHVGQGLPSDVVTARTLGRVPDVPNPDELLIVNKTLVTIKLDAFGDGGCPILYLVIEYRRDVQRDYSMVANNVSPLERIYTIRGLDPAARYYIKVTAHNSAGSSVAEYPFATLTAFGGTIPPPISTARETNFPHSIFVAVKVLTTVFFSACLIVAAFYLSHLVRKWKLKRDHHFHSHHVFFGGSASPMFDSLSMLTNSNSTSRHHGLRQALRFRKRRPRRGGGGAPPSPTLLPPFKSSDTLCTGADLGGSGTSFGPQDTWNKDICPYATFQVPSAESQQSVQQINPQQHTATVQQQQQQQQLPQVTIKLQHHAQLEDNDLNTYRSSGFVCSSDNPFINNITTETFKIKPSSTTNKLIRKMSLGESRGGGGTGGAVGIAAHHPFLNSERSRRKTMTLQLPLAALSAANVVDAKYDSDSDFDYRSKPPRPSHKKRKGRRIASHSSSSSDDAESLSPLPRVRSIEANLEFPNTASATIRSVKRAPNWRGQLRHQLMLQQHQQPQLFPAETTNFLFGSGTIIPPAARFSDVVGNTNNSDHRRLLTTSNTFELQPHRPQEVRTLGRPYTKAAKLIHHQIQV